VEEAADGIDSSRLLAFPLETPNSRHITASEEVMWGLRVPLDLVRGFLTSCWSWYHQLLYNPEHKIGYNSYLR
jgi:hypothetical protein